jgi:hypothetical protein
MKHMKMEMSLRYLVGDNQDVKGLTYIVVTWPYIKWFSNCQCTDKYGVSVERNYCSILMELFNSYIILWGEGGHSGVLGFDTSTKHLFIILSNLGCFS